MKKRVQRFAGLILFAVVFWSCSILALSYRQALRHVERLMKKDDVSFNREKNLLRKKGLLNGDLRADATEYWNSFSSVYYFLLNGASNGGSNPEIALASMNRVGLNLFRTHLDIHRAFLQKLLNADLFLGASEVARGNVALLKARVWGFLEERIVVVDIDRGSPDSTSVSGLSDEGSPRSGGHKKKKRNKKMVLAKKPVSRVEFQGREYPMREWL